MSEDPRLLRVEDGVLHLRGIVNDAKDKDPAPYLYREQQADPYLSAYTGEG
jgi:hypothetical protein